MEVDNEDDHDDDASERVVKIKVEGERLKESLFINKSISALGDEFEAYPYSAELFSPSSSDLGETICSLNFATRVRGVERGATCKQAEVTKLFKYKQLAEKAKPYEKEAKKLKDILQYVQLRLSAREDICRTLQEKEKKLGRDISWEEICRQSHCKKGKRPLDKLSEVGSLIIDDLDLEEDVQQQKDEWVDQRSYDTVEIYKGYLVEKYGEDDSQHPRFDEPLWSRASQATGGKNKGKLYGLSNISDPLGFITGTQSTSCNSSSCGHERQDSEIQRLNKIIEELVKEKESEKVEKEKEAMLERMASIKSLLIEL
ncbi:hypothetical protein R6Q59_026949 [Mikania micrantha]